MELGRDVAVGRRAAHRRGRRRPVAAVVAWSVAALVASGCAVDEGIAGAPVPTVGTSPGAASADGGPAPSVPGAGGAPTSPPSPTPPAEPDPPATTAPPDGVPGVPAAPATALVDRLRIAGLDPALPDYRRAAFGDGWDHDSASGCNTRELVLVQESLEPPLMGERCRPLSGRWTSRYDGVVTTDPSDLEIDHLVPLAEAWRTGAATWTDERREAFANDLDDPGSLVAVTGRSNRSKGDSPPDRWLPPAPEARCDYVADWVRVKARWDLSVRPAEKATLVQVLAGCPGR